MTATLEREIKLRFGTVEEAREAVRAAGGTPIRARRLQEDCLLDTPDGQLQRRGSLLRVRMECGKSLLTFKGPTLLSTMKVREEIETVGGDGSLLLSIFEKLGFHVWFRYEKYREEFALDEVLVAIDETPVGVFVELEGGERGIAATAGALGCSPADYLLGSYHSLFVKYCEEHGLPATDMLFESEEGGAPR